MPRFAFIGQRLWLDFVNTDHDTKAGRVDALDSFEALLAWFGAAQVLDPERVDSMQRRAAQQPAGATAALHDARRVRAALRVLAERGMRDATPALTEINRVLSRAVGARRIEPRDDGTLVRSFIPSGDAFAQLIVPIVDSAADTLVSGELARVRRCASTTCARVFFDASRNGRRRWCDMRTCGNRAKATRHRKKRKTAR